MLYTFMSGFLASKLIYSVEEIKDFYLKRFLRLYPLFFTACVSLFVLGYIGGINYFADNRSLYLAITGIVMFLPPAPTTMWYVSMLLFFCFITPLINMLHTTKSKVLIVIALYVHLMLISYSCGCDKRLLLYYPVYFLALICGRKVNVSNNDKLKNIAHMLIGRGRFKFCVN